MGVKEDIQAAIISGDWEEIRKVFKFLFKEEAPVAPPVENSPTENIQLESLLHKLAKLSSELRETIEEYYNEPVESINIESFDSNIDEDISINENSQFVTGEVPEFETPEYKEAMKKHAIAVTAKRKANPKKQYNADMRTCPQCSNQFDYKKEYPVGEMSETAKGLCHSCARKGRSSRN